jgi:hypothetical protein
MGRSYRVSTIDFLWFWLDVGKAMRRLLTVFDIVLRISAFLDPVTSRCAISKPAFGIFPPDPRM